MTEALGLIAGKGSLPLALARGAKSEGRRVVAVTFYKDSQAALSAVTDEAHLVSILHPNKVIEILRESGAKEVTMIGKVDKRAIFEKLGWDSRAWKMLRNMNFKNDDAVMLSIVAELEKEGFTVISQSRYLKEDAMPGEGHLGGRTPTEREWNDIRFGMRMAKGIAALDIGQTVVVANGAVVAVEAIEGTDETIERGLRIAKKDGIVCKVSKPNQDARFDIPAVGVRTVEKIAEFHGVALAIEAGETIVVDLPAVVEECARRKIAFVSVICDNKA